MSTPTTSVFRACQYRFPTAVVDEFRSTIMHSSGRGALKLVYSQAMRKTVRGLLWCDRHPCDTSSCDTTSPLGKHFVNRDFNAAKNISRCFTNRVRPVELTRNSSPVISTTELEYFATPLFHMGLQRGVRASQIFFRSLISTSRD